jgi:hypothetical protein
MEKIAMLTHTATLIQPPCSFIVLDLETGDAPPEAVAAALDGWKAPANIKDPEKIEVRRQRCGRGWTPI